MINLDLPIFVKGLLVGVTIVAPVGPVNVTCVRRTLIGGLLAGLAAGFGASMADTLYGAVAAFGVHLVSKLLAHDVLLRVIGGIILIGFGIHTFFSSPKETKETVPADASLFRDFGATFLLTLTNPTTVFSFLAVYTAFGLAASQETYSESVLLVAGVFIGALAWWASVILTVSHFRDRFDEKELVTVNRVSGVVVVVFGLFAFLSLLSRF